jgi:hypothetical protein
MEKNYTGAGWKREARPHDSPPVDGPEMPAVAAPTVSGAARLDLLRTCAAAKRIGLSGTTRRFSGIASARAEDAAGPVAAFSEARTAKLPPPKRTVPARPVQMPAGPA